MTTWDEQQSAKAAYAAGFQRARSLDGTRPINAVDEDKARDEFLAKHHGGRRMAPMEIHRGNHATIERLMSCDTRVRVSIAGVFDDDDLVAMINGLRSLCSRFEPPLDRADIEHLQRVRRYFLEVASSGDTATERDARRYRRMRVLGAEVCLDDGRGPLTPLQRFQNLDDTIDADIKSNPSRGEAHAEAEHRRPMVDWNADAKRVLDKVIAFAKGEQP